MVSTASLGILLVCVAFFGIRSFFKGAWHALFSILGLIAAYAVSFFVGPALFKAYSPSDPPSLLIFGGGMMALFILVSFMVSNVPLWVFPKMRDVELKHRLIGAGLGGVAGIFCGLIVIWLYGVLMAMGGADKAQASDTLKNDVLIKSSSKMVSGAVRAGISAAMDDPYTASAATAMITKPHVVQAAMEELSTKPLLQDFWKDARNQFLMAEGDVEQLMQEDSFREIMEEPSVKTLIQESKPSSASQQDAERYMAEQMSFVWRRMRALRSDARVVEILEDEEVRDLVESQNPVALLGNKKIQELVKIVMEPIEKGEVNLSEGVNADALIEGELEELPPAKPKKHVFYKWVDEDGNMRYTDEEHTPEDKKANSEKIVH